MDFAVRKRSSRGHGGVGVGASSVSELESQYPHGLSLYRSPPESNVTLRDFERLAVDRVQIHRALLAAGESRSLRPFSADWKKAAIENLKGCGLHDAAYVPQTPLDRHHDRIAHFALRLAYCRNEELRRWFLTRELELFRLRFSNLTQAKIDDFLKIENLQYEVISAEDKSKLLNRLVESTSGYSSLARVETSDFFKVRFFEASELVKNRKVFLHKGYAYVPKNEFISVLSARLRLELSQALNVTVKRLPSIEVDERIASLLKGVHNSYAGRDYIASKDVLSIENLDLLSTKSYPPCMRQLHETLRLNHHLKHEGRLQYGLFLKAAGVIYDDAMKFWRDEFTKIIDHDKFEKMYSYNVKYNYGLVGRKVNYSAYSCVKIINQTPNAQEGGCPFRCPDVSVLKSRLMKYNINSPDISTIMELAEKGHYQIACSKYFDITHGVQLDIGINHPNQYFEASQKVLSGNIKGIKSESKERSNIKTENNDVIMDDTDFNVEDIDVQM